MQETWLVDTDPLLRSKVVNSASQDNLKDVIISCLKLSLNHFETACFHETSEFQLVDTLVGLIEDGSIQRSDFIFQTKLSPKENYHNIVESRKASWRNVENLLTFHCVSDSGQINNVLCGDENGIYNFTLRPKREGRINHIGFSTHGFAKNIMRVINLNKFVFVNLHNHFLVIIVPQERPILWVEKEMRGVSREH